MVSTAIVQTEIPATVRTLANNTITVLNKKYPAYVGWWNVMIDTHGGVVSVRNMLLSGEMGFVVKIVEATDEEVTRMAGELLERYRVTRAANTNVIDILGNINRDYTGKAVFDT